MPAEGMSLHETYPGATETYFGDSAELSARLCALIRSGMKTATTSALRHYQAEDEPLPRVGEFQIVLDFDSQPVLVLRTTEVTISRFCDVDWDFARDEGENDTLAEWRKDHQDFFDRNGGFSPDMQVVCERFELVADLAQV